MADLEIHTVIRGDVDAGAREYAEQKVARVGRLAHRPVLFARLELRQERDAALHRPSIAKASLDISGRRLRAHVAAPTMTQAADMLEARLRRGLEILAERRESRYHETGIPQPGHWRHGDVRAQRPDFFPRPPEERRLMRRSTFGIGPFSPEEAVAEMELLHHDFLLFIEAVSGGDCLVYRRLDGSLGLVVTDGDGPQPEPYFDWITVDPAPAPVLTLDEALERLDLSNDRFVYFVDPARGRGAVVYRRYDGHYGLVEPQNEVGPARLASSDAAME
jgi:ribosome-associated translation inhibitor RaiA